MAHGKVQPPPSGYTILHIGGRYYPAKLDDKRFAAFALDSDGNVLSEQERTWDSKPPASYSKRSEAVKFLERLVKKVT